MIEDKTLLKCFEILDSLDVEQVILVSDYAKVNPDLFISCCKQYYNLYRTIRFSDDYSVIKKIEIDLTFNEINEQYKNYLNN